MRASGTVDAERISHMLNDAELIYKFSFEFSHLMYRKFVCVCVCERKHGRLLLLVGGLALLMLLLLHVYFARNGKTIKFSTISYSLIGMFDHLISNFEINIRIDAKVHIASGCVVL